MCGRYTLLAEEVEILKEFGLEYKITNYEPRYNIAPGQKVLAIIHDGKEKRAGYLKWGLVPFWAKDPKIGYKMINARSETAHEKPSFKSLMGKKRCLIVADSFYEWQRTDNGKQAKRITLNDRKLFAFAGLWDKWTKDEEEMFTCTILTKEANDFMNPIHDRMPVILPKEKQDEWIEPVKWGADEAADFIEQLQMEDLDAYDVSDFVNSPKNEGPQCIQSLA
ncbi:putative SOS response-associated peptidase YoqW [Thalassobacillus devorans]|uniref:Abasic site processing protein n=1 Tax=Thalassobacillus devorans TaxID=279813 RepID=A0ABQ1PVQ2_9BACI|nr:SOS response-associated peptidase [Thalassobacillus devorans]NIK30845.1 putative SOS response-associated peptidase YedK [Thalassobacillus devorans]GGD04730.1 putative SOS response-associated peptidase YoqW [Thalassobacillus devorans]